ncbi:hypothetical protein Pan216_56870 [Planctomycetes bacterium Pan216]|uniref:Uncharacterized protein n=1 Tax=Kolteria novifilia TaxID=2527975 RepID=A0A518BCU2_9BACT|nr:hypothetical protein Pan216_56870 [Planctomycetes bacterium Pan216]
MRRSFVTACALLVLMITLPEVAQAGKWKHRHRRNKFPIRGETVWYSEPPVPGYMLPRHYQEFGTQNPSYMFDFRGVYPNYPLINLSIDTNPAARLNFPN